MVTLSGSQLDVVLEAVDDAAEYWHPDADCARCGETICDDCKTAWQKRIRLQSLGLQLRKAAGQ